MGLEDEINREYFKVIQLLAEGEPSEYNIQMLRWLKLLEQRNGSVRTLEYKDQISGKRIVVDIAPIQELYRFELRRDETVQNDSLLILGIFHDIRRVYYVIAYSH